MNASTLRSAGAAVPKRARALLLAGGLVAAAAAPAQETPVGLWKTIDDENGQPKSLVRIVETRGVLSGRIEKLLDPDDAPDARCQRCTDERRDQPVVGLVILRNVRRGDTPGVWAGGDILDPDNGKVYQVRLSPARDGRQLEVRGYLGVPLLGRSQTWSRVE